MRARPLVALPALCMAVFFAGPSSAEIKFQHATKEQPLEFKYRTDQVLTDAVKAFQSDGKNPYASDQSVLAQGEKLYRRNCQACHQKGGAGGIGPKLTDDEWQLARTSSEVGRFEVIYGGSGQKMQAFGKRLDQDEILKVMAFIDTFRAAPEVKTAAAAAPAAPAKKKKKQKSKPPVPFTEAFLADDANITAGGEFWAGQCRHCHGAKAYPGKAPKLKPAKYKPNFVYRRVTDGFRKMPGWTEQFTDEERMQIVAYILSGKFSP